MLDSYTIIRIIIALIIALGLSYHGIKKKSLNKSGAIAAIIVGFLSFSCSYRFGIILISFYYTSSKLTKYKKEVKNILEDNNNENSQRNYLQVFASSLFATMVAILYYYYCGDDNNINFGEPHDYSSMILLPLINCTINIETLQSYLWSIYIAHYATANADTWASELGILSKSKPRLVTTLFIREVPPGTNGGMTMVGTTASAAGGLFIGIVYWLLSYSITSSSSNQYPIVILSLVFGIFGSLIDSILGATLQSSLYCTERKCIINNSNNNDSSLRHICGYNILSNELVNLLSILVTMILAILISPYLICSLDSLQCYEAHRLNTVLSKLLI